MAEKKTLGSAKRFGTRYGATLKAKVAEIEKDQRADQKCPYCNKPAAHWKSIGIYECSKCSAKFTGKAYSITRKITFAEAAIDDTVPEEEYVEEAA